MKFSVSRLRRKPRSRSGSGRAGPRTGHRRHRLSGTAPRRPDSCWVWQRLEIRCSSSAPRSANIGFIFRITANSACLLIAIPSKSSKRRSKYWSREVCHRSHNFAAAPDYFWPPLSGCPFRDKLQPSALSAAVAGIDACRIWNAAMRALKIAGAAVAAIVVVAGLRAGDRDSLRFPDLGDPGAGRTRDRLPADNRRRHQDRRLAVAERQLARRHAAGPQKSRQQRPADHRQPSGRRHAVEPVVGPS